MTMNNARNAFSHVIAFDVSKHSLAVHILPGEESHTIENKPKAIRKQHQVETASPKSGGAKIIKLADMTSNLRAFTA